VQLGVGEGSCTDALRETKEQPAAPPARPAVAAPTRHRPPARHSPHR
jgi:hypothetical protein